MKIKLYKYKSRPGVNFTNILRAAFKLVDPESVKYSLSRWYFFMLLGSAYAKAECRTFMKLTPFVIVNCVETFEIVTIFVTRKHWIVLSVKRCFSFTFLT